MQLSSMVHGVAPDTRRERTYGEHHPHTLQHYSQTRAHQPHREGPTALPSNPYSKHQPLEYSYQQRRPQSPPSPPVEDTTKSSQTLPSISNLLTIADGDRPALPSNSQTSPRNHHQILNHHQNQPVHAPPPSEVRRDTQAHAAISNHRLTLPPTPPMHSEHVVDGNQSPSAKSSQSSISAQPYYLGQSLNNMEPHQQRQNTEPAPSVKAPSVKAPSISSQASASPYNQSPYQTSPYASSPGAASTASYYSPEACAPTSGIYMQRPLPSNFPPPVAPVASSSPQLAAGATNPWQHHHYISASSQSAFPQSQDRYICSTCNKAFSRPSSLRIHSHSHTGEKPYKCSQVGCGKAFSVRSNMKRHERGCHAAATANAIPTQ